MGGAPKAAAPCSRLAHGSLCARATLGQPAFVLSSTISSSTKLNIHTERCMLEMSIRQVKPSIAIYQPISDLCHTSRIPHAQPLGWQAGKVNIRDRPHSFLTLCPDRPPQQPQPSAHTCEFLIIINSPGEFLLTLYIFAQDFRCPNPCHRSSSPSVHTSPACISACPSPHARADLSTRV